MKKILYIIIFMLLWLQTTYADTLLTTNNYYSKDCHVINAELDNLSDDIYYCSWFWTTLGPRRIDLILYSSTWWVLYHYSSYQFPSSDTQSVPYTTTQLINTPDYWIITLKWLISMEYTWPYGSPNNYIVSHAIRINKSTLQTTAIFTQNGYSGSNGNYLQNTYDQDYIYWRGNTSSSTISYTYKYNIYTGVLTTWSPWGDWRTNSLPITPWFKNYWTESGLVWFYLNNVKLYFYFYSEGVHYGWEYQNFSTSWYFDSTTSTIRSVILGNTQIYVNQANACYTYDWGWQIVGYFYCISDDRHLESWDELVFYWQSWDLAITYNTIDSVDQVYYFDNAWWLYSSVDYTWFDSHTWYYSDPLAFLDYWELVAIQNGWSLSWTLLNHDSILTWLRIIKYSINSAIQYDSVYKKPNTYYVDGNINLHITDPIVSTGWDYEIILEFSNASQTEYVSHVYVIGDYQYNWWYVDPDIIEYSFVSSWFNFFENWFELINFSPTPSWWLLYFELIAPNPNGTGTIDVTTEYFWPYSIDGKWYGYDSKVNVTYPYHPVAWTYQVRAVYNYQDTIVYPFGTDYNSYVITVSESRVWADYLCDANHDGYVSQTEKDTCYSNCDYNEDTFVDTWELIKCWVDKFLFFADQTFWFFDQLKKLTRKFEGTYTDEENDFTSFFFAKTYAEETSVWEMWINHLDTDWYSNTLLWRINKFVMWFIYFLIFVISISIFIYLARNKNSS